MRRVIPVCLLAALLVTHGSIQAAQTNSPSRGQATAPAGTGRAAAGRPAPPKPASAPPVTPAEVASMLGAWTIPLETPTGRLVATLVIRVEAGKVVAGVSAPRFPEHKITDITKAGQVLTLKASTDYTGALTAYSGPVTMLLTLTPKGQDLAAWFDFNNAGFQIGGTAKKKA